VARCLRAIARNHPHAFRLLISWTTLDERMLRAMARGLAMLDGQIHTEKCPGGA
jgi:hypothetical protein